MKNLTLQECNLAPIENLRFIASVAVPEIAEAVDDTNRRQLRQTWMRQAARSTPKIRRVLLRGEEYVDLDTEESCKFENEIVFFEKSFSEYFAVGSFSFKEVYGKIKLETFMPMKDIEEDVDKAMLDVMSAARKKFDNLYVMQTVTSKLTKEERRLLRQRTRRKANVR